MDHKYTVLIKNKYVKDVWHLILHVRRDDLSSQAAVMVLIHGICLKSVYNAIKNSNIFWDLKSEL